MTFGQNYVEYVQEWMRLNQIPKVSWRILGELADEFMEKREASMKAQKKAKVQRKTTGIAGQIPPPEDVARAHYREKGYTFDFFKWWGHYEACGWVQGKTPLKNWTATMIKFQGSEPRRTRTEEKSPTAEPQAWREKLKGTTLAGLCEQQWADLDNYWRDQIRKACR